MKMNEKIELSKNDNDQLEIRKSLIIRKQNEIRNLELEAQLIINEYHNYTKILYKK